MSRRTITKKEKAMLKEKGGGMPPTNPPTSDPPVVPGAEHLAGIRSKAHRLGDTRGAGSQSPALSATELSVPRLYGAQLGMAQGDAVDVPGFRSEVKDPERIIVAAAHEAASLAGVHLHVRHASDVGRILEQDIPRLHVHRADPRASMAADQELRVRTKADGLHPAALVGAVHGAQALNVAGMPHKDSAIPASESDQRCRVCSSYAAGVDSPPRTLRREGRWESTGLPRFMRSPQPPGFQDASKIAPLAAHGLVLLAILQQRAQPKAAAILDPPATGPPLHSFQ
eukprot:scaffold1747_cov251-Pinguiococcus_pyrenoidosus.AAC.5